MKQSINIPNILAANIKRRRAELGITQSQLAEKLDISSTYMAELETGRKNASFGVITRLSDVLSLRPYELLLEAGVDDQLSNSRDTIRNYTKEATLALNELINITLNKIAEKHLK